MSFSPPTLLSHSPLLRYSGGSSGYSIGGIDYGRSLPRPAPAMKSPATNRPKSSGSSGWDLHRSYVREVIAEGKMKGVHLCLMFSRPAERFAESRIRLRLLIFLVAPASHDPNSSWLTHHTDAEGQPQLPLNCMAGSYLLLMLSSTRLSHKAILTFPHFGLVTT